MMAAGKQATDNPTTNTPTPTTPTTDGGSSQPSHWGLRLSLRLLLLGMLVVGAGLAIWADDLWVRYVRLRGASLFQDYRDAEALQILRRGLLVSPDDPPLLLALARGHRREGSLQKAAVLVNQAESLGGDPDRIDLERKLLMVQAGRIRESAASPSSLLIHADELGPDVLQAFVLGYFANLRTEEAGKLLDMWLETSPKDAQAFFLRAYLLRSLNQLPQAIEQYQQGLRLAPHKTRMRRQLAEVLLDNGELEAAGKELAICRAETPQDDPELDLLLAQHAYRQGDIEQALKLLDQIILASPEHILARRLRGRIRLEQEQVDEALEDLSLVVEREPTDTLAREPLARALQMRGEREAAEKHFEFVSRATQVQSEVTRLIRQTINQPDDVELRFRIGQLVNEFISPEDAARWMRTVLELQPDHRGAHATLADYYEQRGERFNALFHRQQLLSQPATGEPKESR